MSLAGSKLAGGNPENERVENDFYATNPLAIKMLLKKYKFNGNRFLEPCVGNGNIIEVVKDECKNFSTFYGVDLIDRGYESTIIMDFFEWSKYFKENNRQVDAIITNPPFSMAQEFIEECMELLSDNGQMAMFLKIQFLEGVKREDFFKKYPPKYIYVFRSRMATWNNGNERDPDGKRWATTMCHCFMIWEKGSTTEPIIKWL